MTGSRLKRCSQYVLQWRPNRWPQYETIPSPGNGQEEGSIYHFGLSFGELQLRAAEWVEYEDRERSGGRRVTGKDARPTAGDVGRRSNMREGSGPAGWQTGMPALRSKWNAKDRSGPGGAAQ